MLLASDLVNANSYPPRSPLTKIMLALNALYIFFTFTFTTGKNNFLQGINSVFLRKKKGKNNVLENNILVAGHLWDHMACACRALISWGVLHFENVWISEDTSFEWNRVSVRVERTIRLRGNILFLLPRENNAPTRKMDDSDVLKKQFLWLTIRGI